MVILLWLGCNGASEPAGAPPARFQAVTAEKTPPKPPEDPALWCDLHATPETAVEFEWPDLHTPAPAAGAEWTWVNAWATWCKPCIEEMPRLEEWAPKLNSEVGPGALHFISLDERAPLLAAFHKANPELPQGVHIAGENLMEPWIEGLGLEPAAVVLPLHLFLDRNQKLRCAYLGRIEPSDYGTVKAVLGFSG